MLQVRGIKRNSLSVRRLSIHSISFLFKKLYITANDLLNEVEKVLQSHTELDVSDGTFTIDAEHVRIPYGGESNKANRRKQFFKTTENMVLHKKSVITIPNEVYPFCGPVALLVAKYRLTKSNFKASNIKHKTSMRKLVREAYSQRLDYTTVNAD